MKAHFDVVVIGGGLVGLASAFEARERGLTVAIVEAETCARHASSASAGGVRSLNRHPAEIPLARAALPLWAALSERLSGDCGFRVSGQVRVAEDDEALSALETRATMVRQLGYRHERIVASQELVHRIPVLSRHCRGALTVDDDGFADPLATTHAYRGRLDRDGVPILEGHRVVALDRDAAGLTVSCATPRGESTLRADACVNAAGAWGGRISAPLGEPVPIRTAALQMSVTSPLAPFVTPVVGTQGRKLSLKQTAAGAVIIGGGYEGRVEDDGTDFPKGRVEQSLAADNLGNAVSLFPHLRRARIVRTWAGLEGMLADGLPVLGASETIRGVIHAFGFSARGFALVPLIGRLVAQMLSGRSLDADVPDLDLAPFAIGRFSNIGEAAA